MEGNHTQWECTHLSHTRPADLDFSYRVESGFVSFCFKSRIQREWRGISASLKILLDLLFLIFLVAHLFFQQFFISPSLLSEV